MSMRKWLPCLGVVLLAGVPAPAAENGLSGTYQLTYFTGHGTTEIPLALLRFETKDGKLAGTLVSMNPRLAGMRLGEVARDGNRLRIPFKISASQSTFEGKISAKGILGTFSVGDSVYPALLTKSRLEKIDPGASLRMVQLPPLDRIKEIQSRAAQARGQTLRERDANKKRELLKRAEEAKNIADQETFALQREVLTKYADSPAVFYVGYILLADAKRQPTVAEASDWAGTLAKAAQAYGSKLERETVTHLAQILVTQENLKQLALEYARRAEQLLTEQTPTEAQLRAVKVLAAALRNSNRTEELTNVKERIAKLDGILDRKYLNTMPPFKPAPFRGRKGKGDRVAVLELFTGAEAVPCVAADVALDALQKSYKPTELILLRYHRHIPLPDPMTNPDSEARWKYYLTKFPKDLTGTPALLCNGKVQPGASGDLSRAVINYGTYQALIDPLLGKTAPVHLKATASRQGKRIEIKAEISDLAEPADSKRLRFVLVEQTVHYVGGNGLRFHNNVVRALPGGVEGTPLTEKNSQHSVTLDLEELRRGLMKYLEEYAVQRPFPSEERPLELKDLRVVVLVQNDTTGEIIQAVQAPVAGEPEAHQAQPDVLP